MKILFAFLLCFSFTVSLFAQQEWAPVGATWHYKLSYAFSGNSSFKKLECTGDTIINGQSARIISGGNRGCTGLDDELYMYGENNQVFYFSPVDSVFHLFYDFNALAGDSWEVTTWNEFIPSYAVHVLETDSVIYNGVSLKRMIVNYDNYYGISPNDTIVEKFGSLKKLLYFEIGFCDADFDNGLRCYEDSELGLVTFTNSPCDLVPTKELDFNSVQVKIYPTVFEQQITLETSVAVSVKISSTEGVLEFQENLEKGKHQLNLPPLQNGLHFIQLFDNKGHLIHVKRLIKIE